MYEAEEGARLGIVPGVVEPSAREAEPQPGTAAWAPQSRIQGENAPETRPSSPSLVSAAPLAEAEEATVAHPGWTPEPPPELAGAVAVAPAVMGEYSWDAYKQQWVRAASRSPDAEEPLPDVAAAAGRRGASSSWTSADGQRFRWDARAQRWVTEPAEGSG